MAKDALLGRCLVVTQPSPASDAFCGALREHGIVPLLLPSYHLVGIQVDSTCEQTIEQADYVIITSQHVFSKQQTFKFPKRTYITIGPSTEKATQAQGLTDTQTPEHASSEGILTMLEDTDLSGKSVVILTGENPRPFLHDSLQKKGAYVTYAFFYKRQAALYTKDTLSHLNSENPAAISIHSGDNLRYLAETLSQNKESPLWKTPLLLVSARYRDLARSLGFSGACTVAKDSSVEEMIAALLGDQK